MDIATLGLTIQNGQAVQAAQQTGAALDALGEKGEAAAAKMESVGKVARSVAKDHESLIGTTASSTREMGAFAAMQAELTGKMGEHSFAVGRLERRLEGLVAEMTGVNDTAALAATSLAKFGMGEIETLGILAALAAVVALFEKLGEAARKAAEEQDKAIASLEHMLHLKALGAGGETLDEVNKVKARIKADDDAIARLQKLQATSGRGLGMNPAAGLFAEHDAQNAQDEMDRLKADREAGLKEVANLETKAGNETDATNARNLASLITHHQATKAQREAALHDLQGYYTRLAEIRRTHPADELAASAAVSENINVLQEALFPKRDATSAAELAQKRFEALMQQADATRASVLHMLPEGQKPGEMDVFGAFGRTNPMTERSLSQGAMASLRSGARNGPAADLFNAMDRVSILQAQLDATNASRELRGQKAEKPGKDLLDAKKAAADYGAAAIDAIAHSNQSWAVQRDLITEIVKLLHQAGVESKDVQPSAWQSKLDKGASYARSAADLANLIGGSRGAQYANVLNTAANAATNVGAAIAAGGADPIADVQAALSVAALGKQIFGLGKQSHDAARAVAEASEAVKNMLDQLRASLAHDALGSLLANAQAADDARRKQINDELSGKKKENERNAALAQDAKLYAEQQQQIKDQYAKQQVLDADSLNARLLRAKGLTYQADMADLAVKQQQEYNQAVLDGRDAAYMAALAQTQLAEKTALANQEITTLANSPTGFFAERYFGQYASMTTVPSSVASAAASGGNGSTTISGPVTINVPAGNDPVSTAREVVKAIRQIATQTVGVGGSLADAMEVM